MQCISCVPEIMHLRMIPSGDSIGYVTGIGHQQARTHLHHLQLLQPFLHQLLYPPLVAFVLMFMESVYGPPSAIFPKVVICKL